MSNAPSPQNPKRPSGDGHDTRQSDSMRSDSKRSNNQSNPHRPEREFQPHLADDYMLNSFLRDMLRNNFPPDFRQRILNRLEARRSGGQEPAPTSFPPPKFSRDALDEALGAAMADINFGPELSDVSQDSPSGGDDRHLTTEKTRSARSASPKTPYQVPDVIHVEPRLWHYKSFRYVAAGGTIAASLVGGWLAFRSSQPDVSSSYIAKSPSSTAPTAATQQATGTKSTVPLDSVALTKPETLAPSPTNEIREDSIASPGQGSPLAAAELFGKPQSLPGTDLLTIINSQMTMIWDRAKLTKGKSVADDQWLKRITQIAIGREPTAAEQEVFRADKSDKRLTAAAERLVDSNEFAIHWGRLLTEHYLGKTISSLKSQPSNVQMFGAWIQDSILSDTPFNQVEAAIAFPSKDVSNQPAKLWFNETLNRELLTARDRERNTKLTFKYDTADAPIVGLTSTMLHRSGFGAVSCVQCHTTDSTSLDLVAAPQSLSSKQFWSMSAYMMQESATAGLHKSNHSNELFYEEDNGRITVALPRVSVDVSGTSRTVDLKDWLTHNSEARNGLVEAVWKNVFFQPLVPSFGLSSEEAFEERRDLKSLLAGQLQASGSFKRFIGTLLQVEALKTPDASVTASWYLRAQDNVLSAYHLRSRLFAFVPSPARDTRAVRISRGNEIAKWIHGAQQVQSHSQLAQPDTKSTARRLSNIQSEFLKEPPPKVPELDPSQLLYALSVAKPYSHLSNYANRVSNSQLQWKDQIHHAYWLTQGRMANSTDIAEANAIYNQNGQDAKKTLTELLIGLSGSY